MRIKIRSKLIIAISLLVVVLFSIVALLFINEKKTEMSEDIYLNALAFSRLTASTIVYDYDLYLEQGGFVYFNREIQSFFEKNNDISTIKVVSYAGDVLYDSSEDVDKKYEGGSRIIEDNDVLWQIKSENVSLKTLNDSRILFVKEHGVSGLYYVDKEEIAVDPLEPGELIEYLVVPASEKYSVIYDLDYHNLEERVALMVRRIIYLAVFGILLGMLASFIMATGVTRPVAKLVEGAYGIAKGNFKVRVDIKSKDEIGLLGESFNKMAVDLEASVDAKLYKERVTRELELASEIQNNLIPEQDEIPRIEGLEIAAGLISADEVGGDMYDFLNLDGGKLLMYLGDVTGHGVSAGIVSSIANALFYGYSAYADLQKIMVEVNKVLKAKTMSNMFMTLCLMEWDVLQKKFSYVSAGHEQLIHYKANDRTSVLTPSGGIALGMISDVSAHMKVEVVDFQPGDYLIVYSDGIPEAWKNEKESYGIDRFLQTVTNAGNVSTAEDMKQAILNDVKTFTAGYKQMDDITLMVFKRI